jgi:hypothetical protein
VCLARPHCAPVTTDLVRKERAGNQQEKIVANRGVNVAVEEVVSQAKASTRRAIEAGEDLDWAERRPGVGVVRVNRQQVNKPRQSKRRLAEENTVATNDERRRHPFSHAADGPACRGRCLPAS